MVLILVAAFWHARLEQQQARERQNHEGQPASAIPQNWPSTPSSYAADPSCEQSKERAYQDSCVAWRTMDATQTQAWAAKMAIAVGVVGTLAVAATFWTSIGATRASERSADAAKLAADAALASLDRPWLVVEDLRTNWRSWVTGNVADLRAEFKIRNYGQAPAFVGALKAKVFLSQGKFDIAPDDRIKLPKSVLPFPSAAEFGFFVHKDGKPTLVLLPNTGVGGTPIFEQLKLATPLVIPSQGSTQTMYALETIRLEPHEGGIALESLARAWLVGVVIYSGPADTVHREVIRFCYRSTEKGGFEPVHGAPYNQRTKEGPQSPPV